MAKEKLFDNLHMHSTHSDGYYSPAELVCVAKKEGYKAIAITDHDTATAYQELKETCEKEGLQCVFGVEFSVFEPCPFHILGFDFNEVISALKQINYKGYFTLEANGYLDSYTKENVFEGIKNLEQSVRKLANMFENQ